MKEFDKNKESSYPKYWEVNKLYDLTISLFLIKNLGENNILI